MIIAIQLTETEISPPGEADSDSEFLWCCGECGQIEDWDHGRWVETDQGDDYLCAYCEYEFEREKTLALIAATKTVVSENGSP